MMIDKISKFLEKIDFEHFNCVYSCNGMTLMRTEEYNNRMKQIEELKEGNKILKENAENNDKVVDKINWENQLLKKEINKYKCHEDDFKNNSVEVNTTKIITPFTDPEHPEIRKTFIVSKKGVENYIRHIFGVYDEKGDVDIIWKDN